MPSNQSTSKIRCTVVTPERVVIDAPAEFVALPLYDGELGVLPGRAPLIARLGSGMLRIAQNGDTTFVFIDSGFVQIRDDVVTVLTQRALTPQEITTELLERDQAEARALVAQSDEEFEHRFRAFQRLRVLSRAARRG